MLIVVLMCLYTFLVSPAMPIVFLIFLRFCCYAHGFFDVFVHLSRVRCGAHGFLICLCFCWYVHWFFDVFVHISRFRCYAHGFFDLFVFLLVCSLVF